MVATSHRELHVEWPSTGHVPEPDLSVVVVHYETPALLRECLRAVASSSGGMGVETFVVDNASRHFDRFAFEREFTKAVFTQNPTNRGFAVACNQALQSARGRYLLLLNPDVVVEAATLATMVRLLDAQPEIGCATARLVLPDGRLDPACRRSFPAPLPALYRLLFLSRLFPRSRRFGHYNLTYLDELLEADIDSPCGAFMMIRREAYEMVGGLDERYFMYGEDLDWAYRIKQAGWRIVYSPGATAQHVKRASSSQFRAQSIRNFHGAMRIFYDSHYAHRYPRAVTLLVRSGIALRERAELAAERLRGLGRRSRPVTVRIEA